MKQAAIWITLGAALSAACATETGNPDVEGTSPSATTEAQLPAIPQKGAVTTAQSPARPAATAAAAAATTAPVAPAAATPAAATPAAAATTVAPAATGVTATTAPVAAPAATPAPTGVARPANNTSTGFFVSGGKLYDANGVEFRMRGVNHTHWWGGTGEAAIVPMAKAGANAVRAVFGPTGGADTPQRRESIVKQYIAQGVVPVVDYHNATCSEDPAGVNAAVDFWTGPDKAWLQSLERYTILNITNEWGPNSAVYRDTYIAAIKRLRAAGIKNTLVIDAGGACGQLADSIEKYGRAIFDSDPEQNVVFSIHMYGFWVDPGNPKIGTWDGRQPYDVDGELTRLTAVGVPIIAGEFSWQGFHDVTYTTRAAVESYEKHGIGWLAWMWFNPGGEPTVNMAKSNAYESDADLTEFGKLLVDDPAFGWKTKAVKATIF
jgi:mannan endo-1,4-beta-mannosidase